MAGEPVPADDLPGSGTAVPADDLPSTPSAERTRPRTRNTSRFISENILKGVSGAVDSVLDAPTQAYNLAKAGFGRAAGALGAKADDLPELTPEGNFARRGFEKAGMITGASEAETTPEKAAAFGLQVLGGAAVPGGKGKPGAITSAERSAAEKGTELAAQNLQRDTVLQTSRKLGYRVPPSSVGASTTGNAVEGLVARTAPTERVASVGNAQVTNKIVRQDLGIRPGQAVTDATFEEMRKDAGKAYKAVKDSGVKITPDKKFEEALKKVGSSDYGVAAKEYGEEMLGNEQVKKLLQGVNKEVSATAAVEMVKELRRRATKNLKAWDDLEKQDLGYAQRSAAQALEDLIERKLGEAGKGGVAQEWKAARVKIAKSYDAEAAWDGANFSSKELAKMEAKDSGKLTGGMKQAADFAREFPRAAQDVTKMAQKSGFSQYDLWAGLGTAMATGHPEAAAIAAVPWLTQRALLTPAGQRIFGKPSYGPGAGLRGASSLDEIIQGAAMPAALGPTGDK